MLTAITRAVSPAIVHCELSFIDRKPIDLAVAQKQHHPYENLLGKLGARVISLPAEPALPDSMFVEDPAIVLDESSVHLPLGTETRRRERQDHCQFMLSPGFESSNTFLFQELSKAVMSFASAENSLSASPNVVTRRASASLPPFLRRTTMKSSPSPSLAACI